MLIVGGLIQDVGPTRRIENLAAARQAEVLDATGRVVTPGLIDCCLCPFSGADPEEVLRSPPRGMGRPTGSQLSFQARRAFQGCLRHGTTTVQAHVSFAEDEALAVRALRLLQPEHTGPLDVIPCWSATAGLSGGADTTKSELRAAFLQRLARQAGVRMVSLPLNSPYVEPDRVEQWAAAAQHQGMAIQGWEGPNWPLLSPSWPTRYPVLNTWAQPELLLQNLPTLARSSQPVVLQPVRWLQHGHNETSVRVLVDAGAPLALATGYSPDANPALGLPVCLSLACQALQLTPAEALVAGTINGAHALGCADRVGSLERGKQGNLVVLAVSDYRDVAGRMGVDVVAATVQRGQVVYRQGEVLWPEI